MRPQRALLIELSNSHTEIIEPFVKALTLYKVDLILPTEGLSKIKNKDLFLNIYHTNEKNILKFVIKHLKNSYLDYDKVILNSAQGKSVRNLILNTLFLKINFIGFHHNPQSLVRSFTQKIINLKVKKYIVLADFNKKYLIKNGVKENLLHVFYPLVDTRLFTEQVIINNACKIIAIPGVLEQDRRDYFGLIDCVLGNLTFFKDYQFALLGNCTTHDGPEIIKKIQQNNLSKYFITYDQYVPDTTMHQAMQQCLFVMPLMHPQNKYYTIYLKTKISGAYNLAYAYKKPLLMFEEFPEISDFKSMALFYNLNNLHLKINEEFEVDHKQYDQFDLGLQSEKLINFINS